MSDTIYIPMTSVSRLSLDIEDTLCRATVSVIRGDSARRVVVTLCCEGRPIQLPEAAYAFFSAARTVGGKDTPIYDSCAIDHKNGLILYDLPATTTAVAGIFKGQFLIIGAGGVVLMAPRMALAVRESTFSSAVIEGGSFDALRELVADFAEERAAFDDRADEIEEELDALRENGGGTGGAALIDETMTRAGWAADAAAVGRRLSELGARMDEALYEAIRILSFTSSVVTAEYGQVVDEVRLSWSLDREPARLTLDGAEIGTDQVSKVYTALGLRAGRTWVLTATDERGETASRTAGVSFLHRVYYGTAGAQVTGAEIAGMTGLLKAKGNHSITVVCGSDPSTRGYVWYALPKAYGTVTFTMGGFSGDFQDPIEVDVTNAYGHTETYRAYRSTNIMTDTITLQVEVAS